MRELYSSKGSSWGILTDTATQMLYVMHCVMYEINQIRETVARLTQLALSLASSTHWSSAEELRSSAWVCALTELFLKDKNEQRGRTSSHNHWGDCFIYIYKFITYIGSYCMQSQWKGAFLFYYKLSLKITVVLRKLLINRL